MESFCFKKKVFCQAVGLLVFAVSVGFSSSSAQAALLLEPYAGLELGTTKVESPAGDLKYNSGGPHLGARIGYAIPLLFFALDYDYGSMNSSVEKPTGTPFEAGTLTRTNLFAEVGVKLPLIRGYVGYGLLNEWTFKNGVGSGQDMKLKGNAFKAGVGFTGFPFVVIWLDYMMATFNKVSFGGAEEDVKSGNSFNKADASSLMLTVSLPIEL